MDNGKVYGRISRENDRYFWEVMDKQGAYAAGWEWSEWGAQVKMNEAQERRGL